MKPQRRRRLTLILFGLGGLAATLAVTLAALRQNIDHFYLPDRVVNGEAPQGVRIRAGGFVESGSVVSDPGGLGVSFRLTDRVTSTFSVRFHGLLPALFQEDKGAIVVGRLDENGIFAADQILAKHDENYVPPELEPLVPEP